MIKSCCCFFKWDCCIDELSLALKHLVLNSLSHYTLQSPESASHPSHLYVGNKFTLHSMFNKLLFGYNTVPINIDYVNDILNDHDVYERTKSKCYLNTIGDLFLCIFIITLPWHSVKCFNQFVNLQTKQKRYWNRTVPYTIYTTVTSVLSIDPPPSLSKAWKIQPSLSSWVSSLGAVLTNMYS